MLPVFLRLKLRLLANAFRRSPWQVIGIVVGLLYGLGAAGAAAIALIALRFADVETARSVTVIGGSVLVLGFLLVPLVFGVDDTLDPRRFSLFGIDTTRLATSLAVAALVGVPALAVTVVALASLVTWSRDPGGFLLAVLSAPLILATCVLAARVTTSIAAFLLATRRSRETLGMIAILAIVLISPITVLVANLDWGSDPAAAARGIRDLLSWTPLGAVWAFPGDAAAGQGGLAAVRLLIALATVAVLGLAWRALVGWMLVTPQREARAKSYGGLGWFDRMPSTPGGAVAARSLTYWLRDPRYRVSLIMIPIVPVLMCVPLVVVGVPWQLLALLPVPVICLFLGWSMHNDVAYDNTAVWLHVASATPGAADRWGRLVPALLMGVPVLVIGSMLSAWGYGSWPVLGGVLGVSAALLFGGMGFSSIMSARFPYPVVRPGDNPFSQPQSTGATTALVQSVSFLASLVLASPAVVFAALGFLDSARWFWASLGAGVGIGVLCLWIGVWFGARIFERRGPELLGAALLN